MLVGKNIAEMGKLRREKMHKITKKSIISVLLLLIFLWISLLVALAGGHPGKEPFNWKPWWDEKLGDAWNQWLDECTDEREKEMMLAAFEKLEESMIDGSYFDISPFLEDAEEAINSYGNFPVYGSRSIISGNVEKWDRSGCLHYCATELLVEVNENGSYEVYNDYPKRLLAAFLQDEGIRFKLGGYTGVEADWEYDFRDIMDPLFIIYEEEEAEDFWERFWRACVEVNEWQQEEGGCLNQTVRIGGGFGEMFLEFAPYYGDNKLDFEKLADGGEEFERLKSMVSSELTAYREQVQNSQANNMPSGENTEDDGSFWYICKPGDTLWKIAETYLGNTDKIQALCEDTHNQIADANVIFIGQQIYIPGELREK